MQCVKWVICGRHLLGRGRAGLMWVDLYSSEIGLNSLEFFDIFNFIHKRKNIRYQIFYLKI